MSDSNTWPEQEAIEAWWRKHRHELKVAASAYRIEVQNRKHTDHSTPCPMCGAYYADEEAAPTPEGAMPTNPDVKPDALAQAAEEE